MKENVLPFKQKELVDHKSVSSLEKMENLFSVLQSRMEAFNRKTDPKELSSILAEIGQLQGLLEKLKSELKSQEVLENKKAA